jgi:hypothetical protein
MSGFGPGLLLGVLLGLVLGGTACWGLARVLMRVAGLQDAKGLARFLWSGLRRHGRHDPVEVERTLSRALKDQYSVLASGTRLAAAAVVLRVSPEDHEVLERGIGIAAAARDLADFYRRHATTSGWQVPADPVVTIERDISLRPREAVAQRTVRPGDAGEREGPDELPGGPVERTAPPRVPRREQAPLRAEPDEPFPPPHGTTERHRLDAHPRSGPVAVPPYDPDAEGVTTPLPSGGFPDGGTEITEVLPAAALDGVLVRNGREVLTLPASSRYATIGRAPDSAVRVQAHGVADVHAVLERRGAEWYLVPRAPAVFVGGERVDEPVRLVGTNLVGLGRVARLEVTVP